MKNSIQQILILGCGDLGSRVGKLLSSQSTNVIGIKRHLDVTKTDNAINYHVGDAGDIKTFAHFLTPSLSHILISLTPDTYSEQGYRETYFEPLRQLIATLHELSLSPTVLFVSSTSVYAQNSGEIIDEKSPTDSRQFNGHWLRESEKLLEASHLPFFITRLSGIYSASRRRLLDKLSSGSCEFPHQMTNRIHIDDAARAIVHLLHLKKPKHTLFCLTDNEPATHWQISLWLQALINFELSEIDNNEKITGKIILNQRLIDSGFIFEYPSFREGYRKILQT